MKKLCLAFFASSILFAFSANSQQMPPHIAETITYPQLDFTPWVGVIPIENAAMPYDPSLDYKIAIDVYGSVKDSTKIHSTFTEIARTYNLHIANGVPADKIEIVAVIHGGMSLAAGTHEAYQEKYGIDNPNMLAIQELEKVGVKFLMCGQSMSFWNIPANNITPEVKIAISAKTSFVMLDQMGFSYLNVSDD
ncbi:DsrE family protein [Algoriphagus namhaensis]|uniref:DsrE family protein n=1 Tax=Algoriphagus namhaensis TaxID=915353 RepID=A0ABV8AM85_9BACT